MVGDASTNASGSIRAAGAAESRRFVAAWRRIVGLLAAGGLAALSVFAVWSWHQTVERFEVQLRGETNLVAAGAQAFLEGFADDLPYLAARIVEHPATLARIYRRLTAYHRYHPRVASVLLFSPSGKMLLNTARPYGAPLPDLRRRPVFARDITATLRSPGIWIGDTQRGLVLGSWRMPVRYVIRDAAGRPVYILQVSLPLSAITRTWDALHLPEDAAIGLIRPDGVHVARAPAPRPGRLYTERMQGPLMQALARHPDAAAGTYRGRVQSDRSVRVGQFVRLSGFPLVAYISVPWRVVWVAWWKHTGPLLVLGVLGLAGYVGLTGLWLRRENRHARELAQRARRDPLTGLPNRLAAQEWLEANIAPARALALLHLDLSDFKDIYDAWGGPAADRVLQAVAGRLEADSARMPGWVAYLGADEFLVPLAGADAGDAERAAARLQQIVSEPLTQEARTVYLHAAIGIAVFPGDGRTATELMRAAATAVHQAKSHGRGTTARYDPGVSAQSEARIAFQHTAEQALARDEFILYYQPVVSMETGRLAGAEALIRWQDPARGLVLPEAFIPLAEATGWIVAIGEWVLRTACARLGAWRAQGLNLSLSVNIGASQFRQDSLTEHLGQALAGRGIPPGALVLEVTETEVMKDVERSTQVMQALTALGVSVAIDDFGTGYSSLAYLHRLPVGAIKIDQSFVRHIETDAENLAIVRAMIALARVFGCTTVAEGIENETQYRILRRLGANFGQGYWFGHPLPEGEFLALAAKGRQRRNGSG